MMIQDKGPNGEESCIRLYQQHNLKELVILQVGAGVTNCT